MPLPNQPPPSACRASTISALRLSKTSATLIMRCERCVNGSAAQAGKAACAASIAARVSARPPSGTRAQTEPSAGLRSSNVRGVPTQRPPMDRPSNCRDISILLVPACRLRARRQISIGGPAPDLDGRQRRCGGAVRGAARRLGRPAACGRRAAAASMPRQRVGQRLAGLGNRRAAPRRRARRHDLLGLHARRHAAPGRRCASGSGCRPSGWASRRGRGPEVASAAWRLRCRTPRGGRSRGRMPCRCGRSRRAPPR